MLKNNVVYDYIRVYIDQNKYNSNKKIPSETFLSSKFDVCRGTVRKAIKKLREEDIIYSIKGSGSYFRPVPLIAKVNETKNSFRVAIIIQGQEKYATMNFIRGLKESIKDNNIELKLFFTDNKISNERACLKSCLRGYDGIITDGVKASFLNPNMDLYSMISQKDIRCLFYNNYYSRLDFPSITNDANGCAHILIKKIIDKGHKNIGGIFFCDYLQGLQKYQGYIQTLAENNIEIKDENIKCLFYENISEPKEFERVIKKFLKINTSTALVCCNYMILKLVEKLSKSKIELICFDYSGSDWKEKNILCSLNPSFEVGKKAGTNMVKMLNDSNYKIHDYLYEFEPIIYAPDTKEN